MKHVEPDNSDERGEPSLEWPPRLFDEIVDLLAEALVLDYQGLSGNTVNSPRGYDHKSEMPSSKKYATFPSETANDATNQFSD